MRIDDSRPIWAQLVTEFCRRIAAGEWVAGNKVPSVRELALELSVNPNTVQKALGEVDRLGLTLAERTAGRFVTSDADAIARQRASLAAATASEFARVAAGVGMSLPEATTLLAEQWAVNGRADPEPGAPSTTPQTTTDHHRKDPR
ncbi:GntR family transcriptional regulator [Leucobacter insecticola]|uniref:GntR family transcriptional regulator n=1 Tax=Leucobacter insecticola TaxID=2714934 RepID=A0A6G8FHF8_9MICO|nr:GntR family transcriptional regulator [Leucobacter insecticola]QIM15794.1 GntR family transcriptional regulator [Leucobacter insecticola]